MKGPTIILCAVLLALQACASRIAVIESAEVDKQQLERDMTECRSYADALDDNRRVAEGIFIGAFFAGITEYIFSGGDEDFARGAAFIGGLDGGLHAASDLAYEKSEVVKNCLHHRGYIVLN